MIIVFIICAILYLIMIYGVISLYYTYRKDIEELEKRFKVVEKRLVDCEIVKQTYKNLTELLFENLEVLNIDTYEKLKEYDKSKEGDKTMACKRGKRKK